MLEVHELVCGYHRGHPVVGPLSFSIPKGQVACILGPNGVGKTTLFKTILGLLRPLSGQVLVDGRNAASYTVKEFAKTAAYVPQGHVPPFPYRVLDVVVMGRNPSMHEFSSPRSGDLDQAMDKLELMGIAHLAQRDYTQISGGERQLVMIARALAQDASLLVMDEPTSHLDYGNETLVLGQVKKLARMGYTVVMITHVPGHAFLCADQVLAIGRRGFFCAGRPEEVLTEPCLHTLYGIDVQVEDITLRRDPRHIKLCVPVTI